MGISEDFPTITFFMVSSCFYMHSCISVRGFVSLLVCWFFKWLICPTVDSSVRVIVKHWLLSSFSVLGKGWKGQFSNKIYMMHMWYHHKFLIHVLEWDSWIFLSNQSIVSFLHQRQGLFCSCSHENREQNSNLNGRAASHLMLEQTNQRSYDRCWFAKKKNIKEARRITYKISKKLDE